jgi:hypothetical protein
MFIIRETFTAKPGMASKLAALMKDVIGSELGMKARVMTDHVGTFNTVVLETEAEDLGAFEKRMQEYMSKPEIRERMKGYTEMYLTGTREIYKTV